MRDKKIYFQSEDLKFIKKQNHIRNYSSNNQAHIFLFSVENQ